MSNGFYLYKNANYLYGNIDKVTLKLNNPSIFQAYNQIKITPQLLKDLLLGVISLQNTELIINSKKVSTSDEHVEYTSTANNEIQNVAKNLKLYNTDVSLAVKKCGLSEIYYYSADGLIGTFLNKFDDDTKELLENEKLEVLSIVLSLNEESILSIIYLYINGYINYNDLKRIIDMNSYRLKEYLLLMLNKSLIVNNKYGIFQYLFDGQLIIEAKTLFENKIDLNVKNFKETHYNSLFTKYQLTPDNLKECLNNLNIFNDINVSKLRSKTFTNYNYTVTEYIYKTKEILAPFTISKTTPILYEKALSVNFKPSTIHIKPVSHINTIHKPMFKTMSIMTTRAIPGKNTINRVSITNYSGGSCGTVKKPSISSNIGVSNKFTKNNVINKTNNNKTILNYVEITSNPIRVDRDPLGTKYNLGIPSELAVKTIEPKPIKKIIKYTYGKYYKKIRIKHIKTCNITSGLNVNLYNGINLLLLNEPLFLLQRLRVENRGSSLINRFITRFYKSDVADILSKLFINSLGEYDKIEKSRKSNDITYTDTETKIKKTINLFKTTSDFIIHPIKSNDELSNIRNNLIKILINDSCTINETDTDGNVSQKTYTKYDINKHTDSCTINETDTDGNVSQKTYTKYYDPLIDRLYNTGIFIPNYILDLKNIENNKYINFNDDINNNNIKYSERYDIKLLTLIFDTINNNLNPLIPNKQLQSNGFEFIEPIFNYSYVDEKDTNKSCIYIRLSDKIYINSINKNTKINGKIIKEYIGDYINNNINDCNLKNIGPFQLSTYDEKNYAYTKIIKMLNQMADDYIKNSKNNTLIDHIMLLLFSHTLEAYFNWLIDDSKNISIDNVIMPDASVEFKYNDGFNCLFKGIDNLKYTSGYGDVDINSETNKESTYKKVIDDAYYKLARYVILNENISEMSYSLALSDILQPYDGYSHINGINTNDEYNCIIGTASRTRYLTNMYESYFKDFLAKLTES